MDGDGSLAAYLLGSIIVLASNCRRKTLSSSFTHLGKFSKLMNHTLLMKQIYSAVPF